MGDVGQGKLGEKLSLLTGELKFITCQTMFSVIWPLQVLVVRFSFQYVYDLGL